MAIDIKKQSAQLANASTANGVYTAPVVDYSVVLKATATNTHTANVTLSGTIGGLAMQDYIVPAGRSVTLWDYVGEALDSTDTITFNPSVAAVVNIGLTIKEVTN